MSTNQLLLRSGEVFSFGDISLAVIKSPTETVLASKQHRLTTATMSSFLITVNFGLYLRDVVVETKLSTLEWMNILGRLPQLENLYISIENLAELAKLRAGTKLAGQLKTLCLLQNGHVDVTTRYRWLPLKIEILLSPSLTHICLTGLHLTKNIITNIFSLPNLISLDLIGTYVDSDSVLVYQHKLKCPLWLQEVSLPPSWFSFSRADSYRRGDITKYSFLKWLTVPKISLFMQYYDEKIFWQQLDEMMPRELDVLELYGNYWSLKQADDLKEWNKFEILFGSHSDQFLSLPNYGSTNLLSHIIHKPGRINMEKHLRNPTCWRLTIPIEEEEKPHLKTAMELISSVNWTSDSRQSQKRPPLSPPPLPDTHPRDPPDRPTPVPSLESFNLLTLRRPTVSTRRQSVDRSVVSASRLSPSNPAAGQDRSVLSASQPAPSNSAAGQDRSVTPVAQSPPRISRPTDRDRSRVDEPAQQQASSLPLPYSHPRDPPDLPTPVPRRRRRSRRSHRSRRRRRSRSRSQPTIQLTPSNPPASQERSVAPVQSPPRISRPTDQARIIHDQPGQQQASSPPLPYSHPRDPPDLPTPVPNFENLRLGEPSRHRNPRRSRFGSLLNVSQSPPPNPSTN